MACGSDIELRNRALVACALLTGARDSALASLKLKHVDLAAGSVYQDARDVRTKFSKSFTTFFFPVGPEVRLILDDWVLHLRRDLLWGNDDPLFPATMVAVGSDGRFQPAGLKREHWGNASPIRAVFRDAFGRVGLPYFNPHSLRNTLVQLGQTLCASPEEYKAWSQNLGHEGVLTTFYSYGSVAPRRQCEIMRELAKSDRRSRPEVEELAEAVARHLAGTQARKAEAK